MINFQKQFSPYQVFSLHDIEKILPQFHRIQLDRWEKKGYIRKIKQGFYAFTDQDLNESFLFLTANRIYIPSYISLEKALKFYKLIPEEIFQITSVSTKKTAIFDTPVGNFSYRHISPRLFWGYKVQEFNNHKILLAEPEKAILDYLYLHTNLRTEDDFIEMRINVDSLREHINLKRFSIFLQAFDNKSLVQRAHTFVNTIQYA